MFLFSPALPLIDPTLVTDIIGVGGLAAMAIFIWLTNRKKNAVSSAG